MSFMSAFLKPGKKWVRFGWRCAACWISGNPRTYPYGVKVGEPPSGCKVFAFDQERLGST